MRKRNKTNKNPKLFLHFFDVEFVVTFTFTFTFTLLNGNNIEKNTQEIQKNKHKQSKKNNTKNKKMKRNSSRKITEKKQGTRSPLEGLS